MRGLQMTGLCGLLLLVATGCGPTSFVVTPISADRALREEVVSRESAFAVRKIALVEVEGVLQNRRDSNLLGPEGENPVATFSEKLRKAARDRHVAAIVLRINSPGGGVTATDIMYAELQRFRNATGRPVIASMLDVAASGGYYLACGADRIYASPTTVTGSIGVIMLLPQFSGTMAKLGVEMNVIKSGPMKDMGSMFRNMRPEERAVFQGLIDGMYDRFLAVVAQSRREIEPDTLRSLADGRVYLGPQAAEHGLVDEVGTLRDAIAAAKSAAGLDNTPVKVVRYSRPPAYRPNVYAEAPGHWRQVNLVNITLPDWMNSPSPHLMYLWAPGW